MSRGELQRAFNYETVLFYGIKGTLEIGVEYGGENCLYLLFLGCRIMGTHQISFDDVEATKNITTQPGRTAYIDECGNFGFDFDKDGVSKYYILCAVIVKNMNIDSLHTLVNAVKNNNGFSNSEMKSNYIGNNYKRRNKIIAELLPIDFRMIVLVVNKQAFIDGSPLETYKRSFIKFIHQRLYNLMYQVSPKLKIIEDQTGTSEFQKSYKKYVEKHRPNYNFLDEYDFDFTDSKDSLLIQLADIVGGSISKVYTDPQSPNYLEMLKGKILCIDEFPDNNRPYFGSYNNTKYDKDIFSLSLRCANKYIADNSQDDSFEKRMQVVFLKHLIFQVCNVDATRYISSMQLLSVLREYADEKLSRNFLFRRVIPHLRDSGVILASSNQGYKIPISTKDITAYLNQTHTVVSPMLHRMGICRNLIKQQTENNLDILDDPAFIKYKSYFE